MEANEMARSLLGWLEENFRPYLLGGVALLLSIGGVCFIATTCYAGEYFHMGDAWRGQLMWLGLATVAAGAFALLDYRKLGPVLGVAYAVLLVLLVLTLWQGEELNEARRSLKVFGLSFQTGIPTRLVTVLLLGLWCARPPVRVGLVLRCLVGFVLVAVPVYLIKEQPAWGNAGVLGATCLLVLLVHCARSGFMKYLVLAGVVGFVFLGPLLGWVRRHDLSEEQIKAGIPWWFPKHRISRYVPLLQPRGDRKNEQQIELCIRSGGLTGKGWEKGDLQNGGFLPHGVAGSDYILATVAEQAGLLGCVTVLALCAGFIVLCLRVAEETTDDWGRLICVGVASLFALQVVVSVGMALRLVPIIGLTIPMLGRGGTILLTAYVGMGFVLSVQRHAVPRRERTETASSDSATVPERGSDGELVPAGIIALDLLPFGPLRILLTMRQAPVEGLLVAKAKDTLGLQMEPICHPIAHVKAARKQRHYTPSTYELPGFREASMPGGASEEAGHGVASSREDGQADTDLS
jgi:rod shape determining protein RodA